MKAEAAIQNSANAVPAEKRVPQWVMPLVKAAAFAGDAVIAALCFLAAYSFREGNPILSATAWAWSRDFVPYAGILYFTVAIQLIMLAYQRIYNFHGAFSYTRDAIKIFKAVGVSSLLIVAWAFLFRGGFAFRDFSYSRSVFVLYFVFALAAFLTFHLLLRYVQTVIRRRDINLIPTLIVGTNAEAVQAFGQLGDRPELGYRVLGTVATAGGAISAGDVPVLGVFDDLPELVRTLEIQEVIITDHNIPSERLFNTMMKIGRRRRVEFRFAPGLFDLLPQKTSVEQLGVLPMVRLFREPLSDGQRFIKRLFDIVSASAALAVLSPIWLAAAIAVRFGSSGPVLFRQERVGMDGRIFLCYKFRTMYANADEAIHREAYQKNISGDAAANAGDGSSPVYGKVKDDPRITAVGRWLRRSSIDELPQVLNVLKGDMSIVGPRPPIPYEVEDYELWHRKRLDMKPGITGLWQVSGRNRLTFEEMVKIDLYYIENWSIWLDLKIILLTLPAVLRGDTER